MAHLEELSVEDLQQALENVDDKKPTQRLLAAIAYKNGITQTELAEWYGVERRTIYSWLKRLDTDGSLEEAVSDAQRSGRPRKLSESQQDAFERSLHQSPTEVGYDAETWSPTLVQQHLEETYDVEYSIPSCRRLLKEAGLRYQGSESGVSKADAGYQENSSSNAEGRNGRWVPN
jgi:transposase